MGERNKVVIKIASNEYTICGDEPPEYIQRVASLVDRKTREIVKADPSLSTTQTAVLASINMGDEALKQHQLAESYIRKLREMEKRMEAADEEGEALRKEIKAARDGMTKMKQELIRSETENRDLREQLKNKEYGGKDHE